MKVHITDSCIGCGACCAINSDVFKCGTDKARVDSSQIAGNEYDCWEAADICPVDAIKVEGGTNRNSGCGCGCGGY